MSVKIHYIKSAYIQEIPVHGVFGGINIATGQVAMSVFSERGPLPKVVEVEQVEGNAQSEVGRESLDGVIRNVTATMYFDINVALSLHQWLTEKIEQFRVAHPELFENEVVDDTASRKGE